MSSLRFLGSFPLGLTVGLLAAAAAWLLYRRELRHAPRGRAVGWWLAAMRSLAVFLIVMMLTEPIVEHKALDAEAGRLFIVIDDSQSMSLVDARDAPHQHPTTAETKSPESRFLRAARRLLEQSGSMSKLEKAFDLTLVRAGGDDLEVLWRSNLIDETPEALARDYDLPESWIPGNWRKQTKLGDVLRRSHAMLGGGLDAPRATRAIVLLTDGQSNAGESPLSVARSLGGSTVPVFTIGFGPNDAPPDLAIERLEYPESVFREDTLHGKVRIRDSLPIGTPFRAQISHGQDVLWQANLRATGTGVGEIEYAFPLESVIHGSLPPASGGVHHARTSVELHVELVTDAPEVSDENNHRAMHLTVVTQRSRILLLDGRSRWETRYVKNLFARDPYWQLDALIYAATTTPGGAAGFERFPRTREALLDYNLVILGDVPARAFTPEQLRWLLEFVEQGGGMVIVDGARGNLRASEYAVLGDLLPVRWIANSNASVASTAGNLTKTLELASAGVGLDALQIAAPKGNVNTAENAIDGRQTESVSAAITAANQDIWKSLPPLTFVSRVQELAGSETLVKAVSSLETTPLLVSRRYGAGRVLFVATDETWRWRYKVADRVHQRLWNQLARWVQRQPLSVSNEFLSLDSGAARVARGAPVEIRCQLRDSAGMPAADRSVVAVLQSQSGTAARLAMVQESGNLGSYQVTAADLPEGEYRVTIEAEGFTNQSLAISTAVAVQSPVSQEMLQLACNTRLLRQISEASGGQYLAETDFDQLPALLKPMAGGNIIRSATLLWQSYGWFSVVVSLLIVEWTVRKRTGLV